MKLTTTIINLNSTGTALESTWKGIKSIITVKYISVDNPGSFSVDGATQSNGNFKYFAETRFTQA